MAYKDLFEDDSFLTSWRMRFVSNVHRLGVNERWGFDANKARCSMTLFGRIE